MTNFKVDYKVQFHRDCYDHYYTSEATSYTTYVDPLGIARTTDNSSTHKLGFELSVFYTIKGAISFTTDKPIKYVYATLSLCNRVYDVFKTIDCTYMGPFNGNGTLEIRESYDEGDFNLAFSQKDLIPYIQENFNNEIPYVKLDSIVCDFMDGTREIFKLDMCVQTEELEIETPKSRNAKAEPKTLTIFLINLFLSPFIGIIYSIYKIAKGYTKSGKYYLKFSLIFFVVEIILPSLLALTLTLIA